MKRERIDEKRYGKKNYLPLLGSYERGGWERHRLRVEYARHGAGGWLVSHHFSVRSFEK